MLNWCDRTESCEVEKDVEIGSVYGIDNVTQPPYELVESHQSDHATDLNLLLGNQSLPLKYYGKDAEIELGVNQLFCPDFKQVAFVTSN